MADPHELGCIECQRKDRVIREQQIRARKLVDELNEAEEGRRVYRRLAHRLLTENESREDPPCPSTPRPSTD